jgi:hypothetical protein
LHWGHSKGVGSPKLSHWTFVGAAELHVREMHALSGGWSGCTVLGDVVLVSGPSSTLKSASPLALSKVECGDLDMALRPEILLLVHLARSVAALQVRDGWLAGWMDRPWLRQWAMGEGAGWVPWLSSPVG